MDTQHGGSVGMQHGHQHEHVAPAWGISMQHGYASWTWTMHKQHGLAARRHSMIRNGHALRHGMGMQHEKQHGHAAWKCGNDMNDGHAAWIWTCSTDVNMHPGQ
jgi:hypothetical protein